MLRAAVYEIGAVLVSGALGWWAGLGFYSTTLFAIFGETAAGDWAAVQHWALRFYIPVVLLILWPAVRLSYRNDNGRLGQRLLRSAAVGLALGLLPLLGLVGLFNASLFSKEAVPFAALFCASGATFGAVLTLAHCAFSPSRHTA